MIDYTSDEQAALEGEFLSFAGLIRVATPDPLRLWTGVGDIGITGSAFDPDGSVFQGAGRLIDLPAFQRMWNGLAERITVTLECVSDEMRAILYDEADDYRGAIVRLGLVIFDQNWAQIGDVHWARRGRVDMIETAIWPGERELIKTIGFSIGSQLTGRKVPGSGSYTSADQQSRPGSEDDRFCERTPLMTEQLQVRWPA